MKIGQQFGHIQNPVLFVLIGFQIGHPKTLPDLQLGQYRQLRQLSTRTRRPTKVISAPNSFAGQLSQWTQSEAMYIVGR